MDPKDLEKKDKLLAALDKGMVMVHIDARRPGVLVPAQLKEEFHLRLNLSYRFDPPDLTIGEWGVRATLTFSGARFTVALPWSCIFAITSYVTREFWMFQEGLPPELVEQAMVTSKVPMSTPAAVPTPGSPEGTDRPALREAPPLPEA